MAGTGIILPGRSDSPTPVITPARENGGPGLGVCSLCLSAPDKYTCPRCNAHYCSLACYKGPRHTACSELFYRECVLQELREEEAEPRGRRQLQEALLRLREEEACAGSVVNGEEPGLWSALTAQEKEHFTKLLQSGDIGALVPAWKPWWQSRPKKILELSEGADDAQMVPDKTSKTKKSTNDLSDNAKKILELSEGADDAEMVPNKTSKTARSTKDPSDNAKKILELSDAADDTEMVPDQTSKTTRSIKDPVVNAKQMPANTDDQKEVPGDHDQTTVSSMPPLLSSIPPLSSLSHNPSPLVKYTMVNVIYSYAFSLLRHNGDVSDTDILLDFTGTLLSVSGALSANAVYNSTAHALKSAVRAASDPQAGGEKNLACSAMEATSRILYGDRTKSYPLAALSHLYRLLGKVRKHVASDKEIRQGAFSARKKCLFLAAWVNENENCLGALSVEIMVEYKQYLDELSGVEEISRGLQKVWGGKRPQEKKKLIEQVDLSTDEL